MRVVTKEEDVIGLLERARKDMGVSHSNMARMLGVTYQTWCRWRREPGTCPQIVVMRMPLDAWEQQPGQLTLDDETDSPDAV